MIIHADDIKHFYQFVPNEQQCGIVLYGLQQRVMTSAIGNSGTQFDGLENVFYVNSNTEDEGIYLCYI